MSTSKLSAEKEIHQINSGSLKEDGIEYLHMEH